MNRKPVPSNAPVTESTTCQRCLQKGHWTADCKNPPAYKSRPSRTALLYNPALKKQTSLKPDNDDLAMEQVEEERKMIIEQVLGNNGDDDNGKKGNLSESDFSD